MIVLPSTMSDTIHYFFSIYTTNLLQALYMLPVNVFSDLLISFFQKRDRL